MNVWDWLRQQFRNHATVHIGQAVSPALELVGELFMVHSEAVQHRCVQVVHMDRVFDDIK